MLHQYSRYELLRVVWRHAIRKKDARSTAAEFLKNASSAAGAPEGVAGNQDSGANSHRWKKRMRTRPKFAVCDRQAAAPLWARYSREFECTSRSETNPRCWRCASFETRAAGFAYRRANTFHCRLRQGRRRHAFSRFARNGPTDLQELPM